MRGTYRSRGGGHNGENGEHTKDGHGEELCHKSAGVGARSLYLTAWQPNIRANTFDTRHDIVCDSRHRLRRLLYESDGAA